MDFDFVEGLLALKKVMEEKVVRKQSFQKCKTFLGIYKYMSYLSVQVVLETFSGS